MNIIRNSKGQFVKGKVPFNKGKKASLETRRKQSLSKKLAGIVPPSRKGIPPTNKGIKATPEQRAKLSRAQTERFKREEPWNKGKKFFQITGENHFRWKGGVTPINEKIRRSVEYKVWRRSVFERDGGACAWCGSTEDLQADHIQPFAYFPELRFVVENGRVLCLPCHKTTPTYKNKKYKTVYEESKSQTI